MLVGRLLSYWEGNFSGAMLISGRVRDMRYAIVQLKDLKMQRPDWSYLWLHHRNKFMWKQAEHELISKFAFRFQLPDLCFSFQISLLYMNLFYKNWSNKHRESCQMGQAFFSSSPVCFQKNRLSKIQAAHMKRSLSESWLFWKRCHLGETGAHWRPPPGWLITLEKAPPDLYEPLQPSLLLGPGATPNIFGILYITWYNYCNI